MDQFTERHTRSYGKNIGNSFSGILFGLGLLIGSIILLWWNEGRSLKQADALAEMQEKTVILSDTTYNPAYDSKPIWVSGEIKPIRKLKDPLFGVESPALVLRRSVEMYQWSEHKQTHERDKLGGGTEVETTYTYDTKWAQGRVDSSRFRKPEGHMNPPLPYASETLMSDANLGDFYLGENVISHINASDTLELGSFPEVLGQAKNYRSFLYVGENPQAPKVGDIKITYYQAPQAIYSVSAKQDSKSLGAFVAKNGNQLLFVTRGKVSAEEIFTREKSANSMLTWGIRGGGLLLMFVGFMLIMGPLTALANVVPMFGSLVGGVSGFIALVLTLILGSLVIALAWFSARPLLSVGIVAVGVGLAFGLAKLKKKPAEVTEPPQRSTPPPRR